MVRVIRNTIKVCVIKLTNASKGDHMDNLLLYIVGVILVNALGPDYTSVWMLGVDIIIMAWIAYCSLVDYCLDQLRKGG